MNQFLDVDEIPTPTLALEYSYGERAGSGQSIDKQICNVWELGSLANSTQLIEVPIRSHGIKHLAAVLMLDLSQPDKLWADLETSLNGLKQSVTKNSAEVELQELNNLAKERIGTEHPDKNTLDIFPIPIFIVGGKYDIFQDLGNLSNTFVNGYHSGIFFLEPEIRKHVCRCLRSMAHALGASLIFYSSKMVSLKRNLHDTLSCFGYGTQSKPIKASMTDYNNPILIPFGGDSWDRIGVTPSNSERIGSTYNAQIPQVNTGLPPLPDDPCTDSGFADFAIDEIRLQKDEELIRLFKDTELRHKFETILT